MGLFSFVGGLFAGGAQKKAAEQASQAQIAAINRGVDLQQQQYATTRADYMPYTQAGTQAIGNLGDVIGNNGDPAQQDALNRLAKGPLYDSLYRNGQEAVLANASATGGLRGGDTQRGLADFGADTLGRVYQDAIANYGNLAGLGLGATGQVAGFGSRNAENVSGLYGQIGDSQAAKYLTKGRINANSWQQAGGFLDQAASAGFPGGGGGGGFSLSKALGSIFGGG